MNSLQKTYCDGAAAAYRDVAKTLNDMVENNLMGDVKLFADSCLKKAMNVYDLAEQMEK